MRLGGQLRIVGRSVIGWDMTAALALARAMGVPGPVAAAFLPDIEAAMARKINEHHANSGETQQ